jgi:peptide/nickel transport system permease protein
MASILAPRYGPAGAAEVRPRFALRLPTPSFGGLRGFVERRATLLGVAILAPIVLLALLAPLLPLPDASAPDVAASLKGPSSSHVFGTDKLGRDIFSRVVMGARVSLLIGFSVAIVSVLVGMLVGMLSVTLGRAVDAAVMGVVDLLLSFPSLLLAIAFVAVFGAGVLQVIVAIALADIPRAVRLQRSLALGVRGRSYVDAARMYSAPTWWIIVRHLLPNTVAAMLVVGSTYAANAILAEAALSFLGLGITPPTPSWGNVISDGRKYLQDAWWICTFPGLAIVLAAVSLHLLADGTLNRNRCCAFATSRSTSSPGGARPAPSMASHSTWPRASASPSWARADRARASSAWRSWASSPIRDGSWAGASSFSAPTWRAWRAAA